VTSDDEARREGIRRAEAQRLRQERERAKNEAQRQKDAKRQAAAAATRAKEAKKSVKPDTSKGRVRWK
jgi:hypothetical protein